MTTMQRVIEREADRYRRPSSKRGPKKNFPIWMLTRDVFRLFEDRGFRTSLPSNASADDDDSVTPLLRFAEIALSDAAAAAQVVAADHQDLDRGVRAALQESARKDAATPRRTLMMRLREYGRLRRGRNFRVFSGEIPAST